MDITATRRLGRTKLDVTPLGIGGGPAGNLFRPVPDEDMRRTLEAAWEAGLRFFDTAPYYGSGRSERRLGDFLRDRPRDAFVLATKVGRLLRPLRGRPHPDTGYADPFPFEPVYDYGYDAVMRSHEHSLQRLGLDRIDVLLVHDIGRMTHGDANEGHFRTLMDGGIKALEELKRAGDIHAYGLGVNEIEICMEVMDHAEIDCILLAGRYTLLDQKANDGLLQRCMERSVSLIIGGVFNSGILVQGPVPGATFNYAPAPAHILERVRRIEEVCRRHAVPMPDAALQFPLHHPAVATILTGVAHPDMLRRNLAGLETPIPAAFWDDMVAAGLLAPGLRPFVQP